ncbi:hypothetical protein [Streptomyces sp. OE57]|uniref:hypothetical protein n=1 Tax=Streptomyces TaxID=1883 RepID=UPI0039B75086
MQADTPDTTTSLRRRTLDGATLGQSHRAPQGQCEAGYRPQEIAQVMGIAPEAARKNLERGRTLLKQALLKPAGGSGR